MRDLTFRGFLTQYVRQLAVEETNSLYKLAAEAGIEMRVCNAYYSGCELSEHYNCPLIHMDEFFLRPEQRTPSRYAVPGENIDHERFLEEVLLPLRRGQAVSYCPFDCQTQQLTSAITLPAAPLYLIEGSYSCHPALRSHYDLRLFLTVEPEEQLRRITKRNGPDYAQVFRDRWIPLEEAYFSACDVENCCDSVYCT